MADSRLSSRAEWALRCLEQGGHFVEYKSILSKREGQFELILNGQRQPGIGVGTFQEVRHLLRLKSSGLTTTLYTLKKGRKK